MQDDFQPMAIAELIDRAIHVYKKSFVTQLAFAAVLGIAYSILALILGMILTAVISYFAIAALSMAIMGAGASIANSFASMVFITIIIVTPIVFLWLALSSAGHISISRQALYGHKIRISLGEIFRLSGRVFCTLIALAIVSIPVLLIPFAILTVHSSVVAIRLGNTWVTITIFIFAIGYALYLNIFSLAIAVSVFEKKTFFRALFRSWELIKGEFWKIAGMRLLWMLIIGVISMTLFGVLGLVSGLTQVVTNMDTFMTAMILFYVGIGSTVAAFAIMPLDGIFHATLYFNQRIKRDGLDIEIKLARLQA